MDEKLLVPCLYLLKKKAVAGWGQKNLFGSGDVLELTGYYRDHGADELLVFDFSSSDEEHEEAIAMLKEICDEGEIPVIAAGHINRVEDVKKLIYAGCQRVVLNFSKDSNIAMLEEVSKRFGREKILVSISSMEEFLPHQAQIEQFAWGILALDNLEDSIGNCSSVPILLHTEESREDEMVSLLKKKNVWGVSGAFLSRTDDSLLALKKECKNQGIAVNTFESRIPWSDFKLNGDGMVPVIVQDYKTDEVLMLAYMNEEAYETTLLTGKMTYWSRSRNELWTKGMTSGHFQYVKSLTLDCDNDTILAKVAQVGAACHTGNRTCFFQ